MNERLWSVVPNTVSRGAVSNLASASCRWRRRRTRAAFNYTGKSGLSPRSRPPAPTQKPLMSQFPVGQMAETRPSMVVATLVTADWNSRCIYLFIYFISHVICCRRLFERRSHRVARRPRRDKNARAPLAAGVGLDSEVIVHHRGAQISERTWTCRKEPPCVLPVRMLSTFVVPVRLQSWSVWENSGTWPEVTPHYWWVNGLF